MREHNLYALSAASQHYLRERMAEAQRDRVADVATARATRDSRSAVPRRVPTLRYRLLARIGAALVAVVLNESTVAAAQARVRRQARLPERPRDTANGRWRMLPKARNSQGADEARMPRRSASVFASPRERAPSLLRIDET